MDYLGTIDGVAFDGGEARDQLIELGSGRLVPGFEEQLTGAKAGDERTVKITFPDDYGADELKGRDAEFEVTVNEVKRKELPELDDDFASDAAGFDTLDELREDIASKLREADEDRLEAEFREAVLDAVVADAKVEVPEALVDARARELWDRMIHSLGHQGITRESYLQIAGKDEDEIIAEARPDAEQALRREAVIAAVIEAEEHRAVRRRHPRRAAGLGRRARAPRRRSCASASRRRAASTSSRRTSPSARRSICSPRTRGRSPSSRPARATSCGPPTRSIRRGSKSPIWTPGS